MLSTACGRAARPAGGGSLPLVGLLEVKGGMEGQGALVMPGAGEEVQLQSVLDNLACQKYGDPPRAA